MPGAITCARPRPDVSLKIWCKTISVCSWLSQKINIKHNIISVIVGWPPGHCSVAGQQMWFCGTCGRDTFGSFFTNKPKLWETLPVWGSSTPKDWNKSFQIIKLRYKLVSLTEWAVIILHVVFSGENNVKLGVLIWQYITRWKIPFQFAALFSSDYNFFSLYTAAIERKREHILYICGLLSQCNLWYILW